MAAPAEYNEFSRNVVFWTILGLIAIPITGSIAPLLTFIICLMVMHMVTGES